jgi:hypothetical protein
MNRVLNLIGLVLNLAGVLILFRYGMPFHAHGKGRGNPYKMSGDLLGGGRRLLTSITSYCLQFNQGAPLITICSR